METPMADLNYLSLPVNADEGFPQAFRLVFNNNTYTVLLYVNAPEEEVLAKPDDGFFDLPVPGSHSFMVMRVARETTSEPQVIFQRKLVLNHEYAASELAFRFTRIHVAKGNLNGVGSFGSQVEGLVAAQWAL
jgi:hypothetical protein